MASSPSGLQMEDSGAQYQRGHCAQCDSQETACPSVRHPLCCESQALVSYSGLECAGSPIPSLQSSSRLLDGSLDDDVCALIMVSPLVLG